jgi:hypothetical protein
VEEKQQNTILLSLFSEFDAALNPNALIKTDYKFCVMEMSSEILHLHNSTNTLREAIIELENCMSRRIARLEEQNTQKEAEINLYARLITTPDPETQLDQHHYASMKYMKGEQLEMTSARLKIAPPTYNMSRVMLNMDPALGSMDPALCSAASPSVTGLYSAANPSVTSSPAPVQLAQTESAATPAGQAGQIHPRPQFGLRHLMYQPSPEVMKRILYLHSVSNQEFTKGSTPTTAPACPPESPLPSPPPTPPPRLC